MSGVTVTLACLLAAGGGWWARSQWERVRRERETMPQGPSPSGDPLLSGSASQSAFPSAEKLLAAVERLGQWIEAWDGAEDPWPVFGEHIRGVLHDCCGASHVKAYRMAPNKEELVLILEASPLIKTDALRPERGLVGQVIASGRSFWTGNAAQREAWGPIADEWEKSLAWCFPIYEGSECSGVVVAGGLPDEANPVGLSLLEALIGQYWRALAAHDRLNRIERFDPVSGLMSRPAFLEAAERALRQTYLHGEPSVVAVIGIEGLRSMNDTGRWEVADELLREFSDELRRKVRADDRVGRFDGSRFIVLLRRVETPLATLIVRQMIAHLMTTVCGNAPRWRTELNIRCGLAGTESDQPPLRTLVSRALLAATRARVQKRTVACESPAGALVEGSA